MLHFKLGEVASLDDFPAADSGTGEKKAFHNLDCGHFTGKEQSRLFFVKRDVLNDVEQEGGFTHGGTGGDDEHVPRFKPVAFFVQFLKSRGQSLDLAFACDKFFKIGDGLFKDAGQALFILGAVIAFPYLENMGFHRIQQFRYVVRIVKGLRGGLVGDVNDGAEDEFVLQDIEVMLKIGSGGGKVYISARPALPPTASSWCMSSKAWVMETMSMGSFLLYRAWKRRQSSLCAGR